MKYYLSIIIFGAVLLIAACSTANADTDLGWTHNNNQGEAKNYVAEEVNNLNHTPQEAVDKINSLYEGTVVEVELDEDDGVYYYEIEIVNGEIKYDSKVDADNLEVIKLEKGDADNDDPLNSVKRITPEAALDIADDEVAGEITGWELEDDQYEILIESHDELVKIEIDALTADILNKEVKEGDKIDGSGGKGEEAEESVKNNDGKSGKPDQSKGEDSTAEDQSGPAGKTESAEESVEQTENQEQSTEPKEKERTKDRSGQQDNQQSSDYENGVLTSEAAINTALNEVGGIVIEWEYDDEDFEYEIELIANGQEVEVEISAINGDILDIEYDD